MKTGDGMLDRLVRLAEGARSGGRPEMEALLAASAGLAARLAWAQAAQACTEYTRAFGESFNTVDYKDVSLSSVANWPSGPVTLPRLGIGVKLVEGDSPAAFEAAIDGRTKALYVDGDIYETLREFETGTAFRG